MSNYYPHVEEDVEENVEENVVDSDSSGFAEYAEFFESVLQQYNLENLEKSEEDDNFGEEVYISAEVVADVAEAAKKVAEEGRTCCICLEQFADGDEAYIFQPCRHFVHWTTCALKIGSCLDYCLYCRQKNTGGIVLDIGKEFVRKDSKPEDEVKHAKPEDEVKEEELLKSVRQWSLVEQKKGDDGAGPSGIGPSGNDDGDDVSPSA